MPTTVVKTIGIAGDYTTIQAWEDAAPANLVTSDQIWQGELIESIGGVTLTVAGSTTDATRYKHLTAGAGFSFIDNASVRSNALRYNASTGATVSGAPSYAQMATCTDSFFKVSRLMLRTNNTNSNRVLSMAGGLCDQCIMEINSVNQCFATDGEIRNSLFVNRASSSAGVIVGFGAGTQTLRNVTIVAVNAQATRGVQNNYGTSNLVNVAMFGVANGNPTNGTTNKTNCYTDAAANATGWTVVAFDTSTGSGFESKTNGTHDLRIKSTSALTDTGSTDGNITTDISGLARPQNALYDVGCWEFEVAAAGHPTMRRWEGVPYMGGIRR